MPTLLNRSGCDPNNLLNAVIDMLGLKSDAALASTLGVTPSVIDKIRHKRMKVRPTLLMRLHEVTGWKIQQLHILMGDSSGQQAMPLAQRCAIPAPYNTSGIAGVGYRVRTMHDKNGKRAEQRAEWNATIPLGNG